MHWGDWDAMRDWWWVMALGMTVFWILVIWIVVRLVAGRRDPESPDNVLRRRLAAGEITDDEYKRLRSTLRG
jgi:putative membrane protein